MLNICSNRQSKIVLATVLNGILLHLKVIDFQIISLTSKYLPQSPALQYCEVDLFDNRFLGSWQVNGYALKLNILQKDASQILAKTFREFGFLNWGQQKVAKWGGVWERLWDIPRRFKLTFMVQ